MRTRQPAAPERGVHLVSYETAASPDGLVCTGVTPRRTEWLPALLAELRAYTEETIRNYSRTDSWRTSTALCSQLHPEWNALETSWTDDIAEAVAYTHAITTLATSYDTTEELSRYHQQRHADLVDTVESIGTGRGPVNADLGALAKGPVTLHRELDCDPQTITLQLDGREWTALEDRRTGVRALATIAVLAHGFDVRLVVSPRLHDHLATRYPRWTDTHLDLTDSRERSPSESHHEQSQRGDAAWTAIRDLDTEPTKRRLLTHLSRDRVHSYADIVHESPLDIAAGTVSRYVLDLETRDLVAVSRRGRSNTVRLTELGEIATDRYLTADAERIHPDQSRLDESLTPTPHESTSTVSPRREDPLEPPRSDAWVAATGDPDDDADYVQWLTGPDTTADRQIYERFRTPAADNSITLVDDEPQAFEDGRVGYLSHHNDETLIVLQWGGPLATLGRLAGVLLSEKALSTILPPSRVGANFEALHTNTDHDIPEILRRGHQVGWYSDADTADGAWRERITTVRDRLLSRVADLSTCTDTAARADLFENLHGLIASATQLYHAAGIDLTTTLRIPDTETLARSARRRQDLCEFLRYTVPKQSVYGVHSGYRMLFEDRPAKLRRRLPYDVEPHAQFDLTMSWVVAGPTATALQSQITAALTEELATVREAIADGTEQVPTLEIPVRDGTTYPAIRRVIDEIATTHDIEWTPRVRQRLVRLCLHSFGPSDTAQHACPYNVVESILRALNDSQTPTPADVEHAAATLPATRFRPNLTPTATKLYATLLSADQPLGRSELIERAGISASSYDRRLSDIRALERVSAVHVAGHRRWIVDDASTRATTRSPSATWLSNRKHTTALLETYRHPSTPSRNSTPTIVRSGCSHNDTANWWQIQTHRATATALDGETVQNTLLPTSLEPNSQPIVWSARIPGQQPGQRTHRHPESPATEPSQTTPALTTKPRTPTRDGH